MSSSPATLRVRQIGRSLQMHYRIEHIDCAAEVETGRSGMAGLDLRAVAGAARDLAEKLVGRSSWAGHRACSECHAEARTIAELNHNPQCAVGRVLNLLGQRRS